MSLYHSEESCVYCKAKLFADDDVVYCPVCGAPHHRECYQAIGHCALEELHGTENEYSREKELEKQEKSKEEWLNLESEQDSEDKGATNDNATTRCKMCGEEYDSRRSSCPKCNAPNFIRFNGASFDFLGGVKPDEEVDDDITADDAKKFVIVNTHRYIPKFAQFRKGKKASWNWIAFLFPSCWMFSRKMYTGGIISGLLLVIANIVRLPVLQALVNLGVFDNATSDLGVFQNIYATAPQIKTSITIFAFISIVLMLLVKILCGIFGDYWYKKHAMSNIRKIRAESHDAEMDNRKKGGVNVFLFLISYMVLSYLPSILLTFI